MHFSGDSMKQLTSSEISSVTGGRACDPTYLGEELTRVTLWLSKPGERVPSRVYCQSIC